MSWSWRLPITLYTRVISLVFSGWNTFHTTHDPPLKKNDTSIAVVQPVSVWLVRNNSNIELTSRGEERWGREVEKKKKKSEGDEAVRAGEGGQQGNLHKATFKMYNIERDKLQKKFLYWWEWIFFYLVTLCWKWLCKLCLVGSFGKPGERPASHWLFFSATTWSYIDICAWSCRPRSTKHFYCILKFETATLIIRRIIVRIALHGQIGKWEQ